MTRKLKDKPPAGPERISPELRSHSLIIRKILLLFGLLIIIIIGNGLYFLIFEDRNAHQQMAKELTTKQAMLDTLLQNELEKLKIVSGIVKEQNQKFVDFLDYDKINSINVMLRTIAVKQNIDILFLFNENEELLTCNRMGAHIREYQPYKRELLGKLYERVGIESIPLPVCAFDAARKKYFTSSGKALCFKSVVQLIHDSGDIYGYIVLVKLINGHTELAERIVATTGAEVMFYDNSREIVLTSFNDMKPPFPDNGTMQLGNVNYMIRLDELHDFTDDPVGYVAIAADDTLFQEHRRRLMFTVLLPFVMIVVFSLTLLVLLKLRVIDKIKELIATLRQVTVGKLNVRLKGPALRATKKRLDEVENMVIDFNLMMDELEATYKQLEKARQESEVANISKSEFLANMSHELRTPLNAIIGFTEVVLDKHFGPLNSDQEEYLHDVLHSSRHLLNIINDILDLSKVEAGKLEINPWEINIKDLLSGSQVMIKEKAHKHGLELALDFDDNLPETVYADERKIKQVVYNLLANAVKFTPDGGKITIAAKQVLGEELKACCENSQLDRHGKYIMISVRDTGVGISNKDLERIFAPFEQADGSFSRKFQGTGLGLSLSKKFVELQGGCIWAESSGNGSGSIFSFVVPVDVRDY